jgi:CheY-like chemotaxis protein
LACSSPVASELINQIEIRLNVSFAEVDSAPMKVLRIIVVEDEAVIAMLLAEVLTGMGHDVCAIEVTEADAVAAAARCRPDIMILDARLGDGSGISAIEQILCTGFVPHVFVTGDALRVQTLRPGAVVIQKPFDEAALARAMQRALGAAAVT